jgi:hypothetical protein
MLDLEKRSSVGLYGTSPWVQPLSTSTTLLQLIRRFSILHGGRVKGLADFFRTKIPIFHDE